MTDVERLRGPMQKIAGFSVYFLGIWIVELIGPNPDTPNIELTPNTEFGIILLGIKNFNLLKA